MTDLKTDARVAVHEAAHAVVGVLVGRCLVAATIVPGDDYSGRVHWLDGPEDRPGALKSIVECLAGPVAAARFDGLPVGMVMHGRVADGNDTYEIAKLMRRWGVSTDQLAVCAVNAARLVDELWPVITEVARQLTVERTVHHRDVQDAIRRHGPGLIYFQWPRSERAA